MRVERLRDAAIVAMGWIQEKPFPQLIQQFHQQVSQLQTQSTPQHAQAVLTILEQIRSASLDIDTSQLDPQQVSALQAIGAAILFRESQEKIISDATASQGNPAQMATDLLPIAQLAAQFHGSISQLANLLPLVEPNETASRPGEGERLVRIVFARDASLETLDDLNAWSTKWIRVFVAYSRLAGVPPEQVKLVGVLEGSVILEILANSDAALELAGAVSLLLVSAERLMHIRKTWHETRNLKLENNRIEQLMREEHNSESERIVESVTERVTALLAEEIDDREDIRAAVRFANKDLLSFVEQGGEVLLLRQGAAPADDEVIEKIESQYPRLRQIEAAIGDLDLIEEGKSDTSETTDDSEG